MAVQLSPEQLQHFQQLSQVVSQQQQQIAAMQLELQRRHEPSPAVAAAVPVDSSAVHDQRDDDHDSHFGLNRTCVKRHRNEELT